MRRNLIERIANANVLRYKSIRACPYILGLRDDSDHAERCNMSATQGIPPAVTEETQPFWDAAREGRLLVERCGACGAESFPPRSICRACHSRDTAFVEIVSQGYIYSFTINHQRWLPDLQVPFAIVLVEFKQHPGVRIAGRLRGCPLEDITIGMPVAVGFEPGPGGFHIPSFLAVLAVDGQET